MVTLCAIVHVHECIVPRILKKFPRKREKFLTKYYELHTKYSQILLAHKAKM